MENIEQHAYWLGCCCILIAGMMKIYAACLRLSLAQYHYMHRAFYPVILAHLSIFFNLFPRDIYHLRYDRLEEGIWCKISAQAAIASMIAFNVNTVSVAYLTHRLVSGGFDSYRATRLIVKFTGAAWILGLGFALYYGLIGEVAPFRGIYCCLGRVTSLKSLLPMVIIASGSFFSMLYYLRDVMNRAQYMMTHVAPSEVEHAQKTEARKQVESIRTVCLSLVASYYICWSPVIILAIGDYFGWVNRSIWWDIIAAWIIKLQAFCDGSVLNSLVIDNEPSFQQEQSIEVFPTGFESLRQSEIEEFFRKGEITNA